MRPLKCLLVICKWVSRWIASIIIVRRVPASISPLVLAIHSPGPGLSFPATGTTALAPYVIGYCGFLTHCLCTGGWWWGKGWWFIFFSQHRIARLRRGMPLLFWVGVVVTVPSGELPAVEFLLLFVLLALPWRCECTSQMACGNQTSTGPAKPVLQVDTLPTALVCRLFWSCSEAE